MTFLEQRKPFYLENNTLNVIFPNQKYMNSSITEWFNGDKIPWLHTIRGYYMETEDDCYVMLYENNFNIPNMSICVVPYIFTYFPNIKWIGLGCHIGAKGTIWKPQLKIIK